MCHNKISKEDYMKKLFFTIAVVFFTIQLFASNPVKQGNFSVSMPVINYYSLGGDLYEYDGDRQTGWEIGMGNYQFGVEWFVIDNLAIGSGFSYLKVEAGNHELTEKSIVPAVTYYLNIDDKIIPYAGIGFGYGVAESDGVDSTYTSIMFKLGGALMLGDNIAGFGELFYSLDSEDFNSQGAEDGNAMGISLGFKAFF